MKIVITGATGLLGKCLVKRLSEHELILLGRSEARLKEIFDGRKEISLHETDYSLKSLLKIISTGDTLIHLAARPTSKEFTKISDYYWMIHIAENVFRACSKSGIKNVIFVSSAMIYSPDVNQIPYIESEAVHPSNLYAICKMTAENVGFFQHLNLKCLRMALITLSERRGLMLNTFIQKAINKQPIIIFGDGRGVREYIYVKDAAAAIEAAVCAPNVRGVFNIGSGIATSHRNLAELVNDVFSDGSSEIIYDLTKPEASSRYPMNNTLAQEILGWKCEYSVRQALEDMKQENIVKGHDLVQKPKEICMKLNYIAKESNLNDICKKGLSPIDCS